MSGSSRTHTLSRASGPTRIRNKRAEKIVAMVDGYDSITTIATALRNVFFVWVVAGIVMVGVGLISLGTAGVDESDRLLLSVRAGSGLLNLITVILSIVWAVKAWSNVRRLGKKARVGYGTIFLRHISAIPVILVAWIVAAVAPSTVRLVVVIMIGALIYMSLMTTVMTYQTVSMLWRTSSPPTGYEEGLPHHAVVWVVTWTAYSSLLGVVESARFSTATNSLFVMLAGGFCIVAAGLASRLVMEIARRQDARLAMIISHVEDGEEATMITGVQIESAWAASESLVEFPT